MARECGVHTHTLACVWLQGFKVARVYGKSTHNYTQLVPSLRWTGVVLWTWHGIHCLVVMASKTILCQGKAIVLTAEVCMYIQASIHHPQVYV
jgi:hypothetical protein